MKKRRSWEIGPLPRWAPFVVAMLTLVFVVLVLIGGRFYLATWRGDIVFLPTVLFLGLLLVAAVVVRLFKKN